MKAKAFRRRRWYGLAYTASGEWFRQQVIWSHKEARDQVRQWNAVYHAQPAEHLRVVRLDIREAVTAKPRAPRAKKKWNAISTRRLRALCRRKGLKL